MKIVSLDDIKSKYGLDSKVTYDNKTADNTCKDSVEQFDKAKTRVLKYVMYKKRTENEVRVKFAKQIDKDLLEDVIEELKSIRIYKRHKLH